MLNILLPQPYWIYGHTNWRHAETYVEQQTREFPDSARLVSINLLLKLVSCYVLKRNIVELDVVQLAFILDVVQHTVDASDLIISQRRLGIPTPSEQDL